MLLRSDHLRHAWLRAVCGVGCQTTTEGKDEMDLSINVIARISHTFDYVATRGDNEVKYGVWYGGTAPLNKGDNGVYIGDVARINGRDDWVATTPWDSSRHVSAADQQWIGGFKTRKEASVYLVGRKFERDNMAVGELTTIKV